MQLHLFEEGCSRSYRRADARQMAILVVNGGKDPMLELLLYHQSKQVVFLRVDHYGLLLVPILVSPELPTRASLTSKELRSSPSLQRARLPKAPRIRFPEVLGPGLPEPG